VVDTVIELGEDFVPTETATEIIQRGRRTRFAAVAASLVLLVLLTIGGAATPTPALRRGAAIPAAPQSVAMLVGTRLLIAGIYDGGNRLKAYDIRTGDELWSTRLTVLAHGSSMTRLGNAVVVSYSSDTVSGDLSNAVDVTTGRVLWRSEGWVLDTRDGDLILMRSNADQSVTASGVRPATGATIWQQNIGVNCRDSIGSVYVQVCDDGVMRVLDLATGQLRGAMTLDLGGFQQTYKQTTNPPEIAQSGNVILVGHYTRSRPLLDAFDAGTMRPLWSRDFDPASNIADCGSMFCVYGAKHATGIDPATGADRPFPGYDTLYSPAVADVGSVSGEAPRGVAYALVPPNFRPDRDGTYPGATIVATVADSEPNLVPEPAPGSVFLATVNPTSGRMTIIDEMAGIGPNSCAAFGGYLGCSTGHDQLQLWRLR
jgi:outer membrane protein assembly factor BamB